MGSREGLNEIMFVKFINNICKVYSVWHTSNTQ